MANTKIILSGQSDQNLVDPTIIRPVGIVPDDIAGLPAALTGIDAAILKNYEDSTKADSDLSTVITANKVAAEAADAGLQSAIDLEKDRLDVILSGSQVNLNQFKEVIEFVETKDLQNDEELLGAVTSINVDITANKVAAEAADDGLQSAIDQEKFEREAAVISIERDVDMTQDIVSANNDQFKDFKANVQSAMIDIESKISTEESAREEADSDLDSELFEQQQRVDELIRDFNDVIVAATREFVPMRHKVPGENYDSERGIVSLKFPYEEVSFMFFINGLMVEPDEDYTVQEGEMEGIISIALNGEAKTLADNGAKMVEYGVRCFDLGIPKVEFLEDERRGEEGEDSFKLGEKLGEGEGEGSPRSLDGPAAGNPAKGEGENGLTS